MEATLTNEKSSLVSKDACKYGIDCPLRPRSDIPYCCGQCSRKRKSFINDANRHLWTDEIGFHSPQGCKLPREDMPIECKEYDCRQRPFVALLYYVGGKWQALRGFELEHNETEAIIMAINATMKVNRGLKKVNRGKVQDNS